MKEQEQMTSAESRTLREWLGLSTADTADLSGMTGQSVRRSEAGKIRVHGRTAPHPTAVSTLRQIDQVTARAADAVEPIIFRDQDDYESVQPQPPLGDYRIHNASVLRKALDIREPRAICWATPGQNHDDATIQAMRQRTGTSLDWVADQTEQHVNKLRRVEQGHETVPDDVRTFLAALIDDMNTYRDLLLDDAAATAGPAVFVRFRSDADLEDAADDAGLELPAGTHALAAWEAVEQLRSDGRDAALIWLNPREYQDWLDGRTDSRAHRSQWATHEWTSALSAQTDD